MLDERESTESRRERLVLLVQKSDPVVYYSGCSESVWSRDWSNIVDRHSVSLFISIAALSLEKFGRYSLNRRREGEGYP